MAGLTGLTAADIDIQDALQAPRWAYEGDWIPHPVVRLTTTLPVAVNDEDGVRTVVRARWGFPVGKGRPIGNARDDRLTESRMWSSMLGRGPCLVPSTGIYEMVKTAAGKTSYWFRRTNREPMILPGLCASRKLGDDRQLCCAIITTEPNAFFAQFHDRQVCQLTPQEADAWMAGTDPDELLPLLHAPPDDDWEAVPVDSRIFQPGRIEMEHLVETGEPIRAGDPAPGQQTLF